MKNPVGLLVTILIIVAPIIWCCINLVNVNKEYDDNINKMQNMTDDINNIIDDNVTNNGNTSGDNTYVGSIDGESFTSPIGAPIGKIIENATVNENISVYVNPDETSDMAGSVTKDTVVTAQDYPNNWTRIKVGAISGWVKTDKITKPENVDTTQLGSVVGKNAKVNVDSLNVRANPSTSANIVERLTLDTDVKILATSDDNKWYQIQYRTLLGWVSADYVTVQY